MKHRTSNHASAFACAAVLTACQTLCPAAFFTKALEFGPGTPGEKMFFWDSGVSEDGEFVLWEIEEDEPPTNEDSFAYKGQNARFIAMGNRLEDSTMYAKTITLESDYDGGFFIKGKDQKPSPSTIRIEEDINVKVHKRADFNFGNSAAYEGFDKILIGGNANFTMGDSDGCGFIKTVFNPWERYGEANPSMVVGGTVNFTKPNGRWLANAAGTQESVPSVDAFIQLGGLNGEKLLVSTNDPGARSLTLIFRSDGKRTFTGGKWTGAFSSFFRGGPYAKIVMDGGNGGSQTIQFLDIGKMADGSVDSKMKECDLDMISGKLEISTPSLFGGLNSVRFAGGEITVGENKTLGMKSLAWKNGRFVFKIYSDVTNDCGAIRIDDTTKLAGGKYYIDLVLDEKIRNIIGSYNIIRGGMETLDLEKLTVRVLNSKGEAVSGIKTEVFKKGGGLHVKLAGVIGAKK